jgi:hypothetical protein
MIKSIGIVYLIGWYKWKFKGLYTNRKIKFSSVSWTGLICADALNNNSLFICPLNFQLRMSLLLQSQVIDEYFQGSSLLEVCNQHTCFNTLLSVCLHSQAHRNHIAYVTYRVSKAGTYGLDWMGRLQYGWQEREVFMNSWYIFIFSLVQVLLWEHPRKYKHKPQFTRV